MPEGIASRIRTGIAFYAERGDEITRIDEGVYLVPSSCGSGAYRVTLTEDGNGCPCADRGRSGLPICRHGASAMIADAKRIEYRVDSRHDSRFGVEHAVAEYRSGQHVRDHGFYCSYFDALNDCLERAGVGAVAA